MAEIIDPFKTTKIVDPFSGGDGNFAGLPDRGFPYDKPGMEYGNVLPVARDTKTGELSLAVPEMIRSPLRGAISRGQDISGVGKPVGDTTTSPDELAAVMAMGGMKPAPGEAVGELAPPSRMIEGTVKDAHDAGYVLPPAMTGKPGKITRILGAWGGKTELQQAASVANQEVTNKLAARALALPEETTLNEKVLETVRANAGKAYEAVEKSVPIITPDEKFVGAIRNLGGANSEAGKYFPHLMNNPAINEMIDEVSGVQYFSPKAGLEIVKELRHSGTINLKAPGDPMRHALGLAQRQAADEIDNLMDRVIEKSAYSHGDLEAATDPNLVKAYRDARQQIAKSYDVQGAMNPATGDVNALGIGRLAIKGRPLTGDLEKIANAANAFPRALQNVARFGGMQNPTELDFFGSALGIAKGDPSIIGMAAGRPLARAALLSKRVQGSMIEGRHPILPGRESLPLLVPGAIAGSDAQSVNQQLGNP